MNVWWREQVSWSKDQVILFCADAADFSRVNQLGYIFTQQIHKPFDRQMCGFDLFAVHADSPLGGNCQRADTFKRNLAFAQSPSHSKFATFRRNVYRLNRSVWRCKRILV